MLLSVWSVFLAFMITCYFSQLNWHVYPQVPIIMHPCTVVACTYVNIHQDNLAVLV